MFTFCKFITSISKLLIETGWWNNIARSSETRDEFHYIMQCNFFFNNTQVYENYVYEIMLLNAINVLKFKEIMCIAKSNLN